DAPRGAERRALLAARARPGRPRPRGAPRDVHRARRAVHVPSGRLADRDGTPPVARQAGLGGQRPADAAAPGRAVCDLGLLVRRPARVPRLVRQLPGAVPANGDRLRHAGSRAGHLGAGGRALGVEGRRAARAARARGTLHGGTGRADQGRGRACRCAARCRRPLVGRCLVVVETGRRVGRGVAPRRSATLLGFLVLGTFWGAWAAVLPSVQLATGTSKGALGFALLFVSLGALPAMLLVAGPAVDRYGARAVAVACAVFAVAATLPGLATSLLSLMLALLATGAASGALDVGINANAARIEADTGRRLMPLAHALYSVGVLVGAVAAGLARSQGVGREPILVAVAVSVGLTALLLASDRNSWHPALLPGTGRGIRIERALLLIGLVGAAAFVVEGGIESWSALFLERQLHAEPAVSGLGPGVFGASMALGRFYGQATRLGDRALLAGGAAVAVAGCLLAASAPNAPLA